MNDTSNHRQSSSRMVLIPQPHPQSGVNVPTTSLSSSTPTTAAAAAAAAVGRNLRTLPLSPSQHHTPPQQLPIFTRLRNLINVHMGEYPHHHHPHHHHHHPTTTNGSTSTSTNSGATNTQTMNVPSMDNSNSGSHHRNIHNNNTGISNTNGHLDPNVLMGLNIAGVASTIIHTMMGLQTERHLLANIAKKVQQHHISNDNNSNNNIDNESSHHFDPLRNLVTDMITLENNTMVEDGSHEIMIRTTNSPKLQYDFLIRMIGTAIIFYYSINALPFQSHYAKGRRLDIIGAMGCAFVVIFLVVQQLPIFIPFYEWMRILLIVTVASPVINDTSMFDAARIQFIMSSQMINFIATLAVRYMYEFVTAAETIQEHGSPWLSNQHVITNMFALLSAALFAAAQNTINSGPTILSVREAMTNVFRQPRIKVHTEDGDHIEPPKNGTLQRQYSNAVPQPSQQPRSMIWYRIVRDMCYSNNVQRWIIMQILLEVQMSILYLLFLYTILYEMDHNVRESRFLWTLFRLRKVDTILVHIPMFLFGYTGVYYTLFATLFGISLYAYCITNHPSESMITVHILTIVYYISCMAVHSAGFNVAMADLTMSLRYSYTKTATTTENIHRRSDHEPNIAGIVIAYNSFICKPIAYFISGIVAAMLRHGRSTNTLSSTAFYVLIYTTLVSSAVQLYVWKRYDLVKHRTTLMRDELSQIIPK